MARIKRQEERGGEGIGEIFGEGDISSMNHQGMDSSWCQFDIVCT